MDLEKTLLRKVGEAIHRFEMIRDGDRIAVAVSGGKDSVTMLEALLLLQKRAPIDFTVCAFTVEQGKFLRARRRPSANTSKASASTGPITPTTPPSGSSKRSPTTAATSAAASAAAPSTRSRAASAPTSSPSATPPTISANRCSATSSTPAASVRCPPSPGRARSDFRLIRPLIYVTEEITRALVESKGVPVVPCGCSLRTGTVRRGIREAIADWEREHPHLRENILSAMGNINHGRLLDTRYLDPDGEIEAKGRSTEPEAPNSCRSCSQHERGPRHARVIAESRRQIERLPKLGWYHSIELPDGSVIQGHQTLEQLRAASRQFPIPADLTGKRVLDIGAWDGWFSFEMERRGAAGAGARFHEEHAAARSPEAAGLAHRLPHRRHLPPHLRRISGPSISCCSSACSIM